MSETGRCKTLAITPTIRISYGPNCKTGWFGFAPHLNATVPILPISYVHVNLPRLYQITKLAGITYLSVWYPFRVGNPAETQIHLLQYIQSTPVIIHSPCGLPRFAAIHSSNHKLCQTFPGSMPAYCCSASLFPHYRCCT